VNRARYPASGLRLCIHPGHHQYLRPKRILGDWRGSPCFVVFQGAGVNSPWPSLSSLFGIIRVEAYVGINGGKERHDDDTDLIKLYPARDMGLRLIIPAMWAA